MTIEEVQTGVTTILNVAERMDAESTPPFNAKCGAYIAAGAKILILNLDRLTYVSSLGLGCFVALAKTLRSQGGDLRVCQMNGLVKQIFEITGLQHAVGVYETVEAALTAS